MKFKLFGKIVEIKNDLPPLSNDEGWRSYLSGKNYNVNSDTALKVSTVIRCVDVVAKTIAHLPLNIYQITDKGKEKAKHPLQKILHILPNPETTAYEFWHMYIFNLMLTTGAYAKIERNRNGFIKGLWNIPTACVKLDRNTETGERYIDVLTTKGVDRLREGEFMFTPGLRVADTTNPEDPLKIAADVLGLTMALNGYSKDYFEKGTNLGGTVELPSELTKEAYERLKKSWKEAYSGINNQHKWAILEGGAKATQLGINPNDSQMIESRKFQIAEICRLFGIPPHKVFDLERATFSNIEQQNIEFVQESIAPMSVRLEQTIYKDLLTGREQDKYYAKFNVNALLRGDIASRTAYYNTMRQNGVLNADDIRELEDMNLIGEEKGGKVYLVNGNMISLENAQHNLPKSMQKGDNSK